MTKPLTTLTIEVFADKQPDTTISYAGLATPDARAHVLAALRNAIKYVEGYQEGKSR